MATTKSKFYSDFLIKRTLANVDKMQENEHGEAMIKCPPAALSIAPNVKNMLLRIQQIIAAPDAAAPDASIMVRQFINEVVDKFTCGELDIGDDQSGDTFTMLRFINVISWFAAVRINECGRLTLNFGVFMSILAEMQLLSESARDVVRYLRSICAPSAPNVPSALGVPNVPSALGVPISAATASAPAEAFYESLIRQFSK